MEASIRERINHPADGEADATAEITLPKRKAVPVVERFAGRLMTEDAAKKMAIAVSQEGMGA